MKTILALLACLSEFIILCVIEAEFFYDKLGVFWKLFFVSLLLSIMTITWKAIVGQKKEEDLNNTEHANNPNQIRSIDDEINVPSKAMKKKERLIIVLLYVWSFFNFLLFLIPFGYNNAFLIKTNEFFPFTDDFDISYYDYTELFFYVGGAWFLYLLYKKRVKLKIVITKNKDKLIIVSLCVWSFLHTFILLRYIRVTEIVLYSSDGRKVYSPYDMFYPFTFNGRHVSGTHEEFISDNFDMRFYDFSEYFVYVGGAWMIYFLYRYLKNRPTE